MATKIQLKAAIEPVAKFGAFYSGGHIEWHDKHLYCQNNTKITKLSIETGVPSLEIGSVEETEEDTILTFTTTGEKTVTAHKSGLLKLWDGNGTLIKHWKSIHNGPVAILCFKDDLLLSGGSDGVVRVWDIKHHACISALRGAIGVVNLLTHHNSEIFASGDDGVIVSWQGGKIKQTYSGHFSKVTCLKFSNDGEHFVSAGRDRVLILWKLNDNHAIRTVPVYQSIEDMLILPTLVKLPTGRLTNHDGIIVACAGEKGCVSVWDVTTSKEVYKQDNSLISPAAVEGSLAVTHLLVDSKDSKCEKLALVSAEHNIIIHKVKSFAIVKQLVGCSDQIHDITFCGENDDNLAVATNSNDLKLYTNSTMNCTLLKGHTDIILSVTVAPFNKSLLASGSKDRTVRLWRVGAIPACVAVGLRHVAAISTVRFFNMSNGLFTGSNDNTVKVWDISHITKLEDIVTPLELTTISTGSAHTATINALAVSLNDKILASCGDDKLVKLWTEKLTLLGSLQGHKRGVWCCRFSPIDQVLASSSGDCSIKLWSVVDFTCLKTFQCHDAAVLRVEFISGGMQLMSCGADGLLKLFDVKTSEATLTLDVHDGRVWCLAIAEDERTFFTGGGDSMLVKWADVTEERRVEKLKDHEQSVLDEQQLSNFLQQEEHLKALRLSLKLKKPFTVKKIVQAVMAQGDALADTVHQLASEEKDTLLQFASDWNTNSGSAQCAQMVLNILLREIQAGTFAPGNLRTVIEQNVHYTERHYVRMSKLMQVSRFLDYTLQNMELCDTS